MLSLLASNAVHPICFSLSSRNVTMLLWVASLAVCLPLLEGQVIQHGPETCILPTVTPRENSVLCATHSPFHPNRNCAMPILSAEQKRAFVRDGFLLLPDPLPTDLIDRAERFADEAFTNNKYNVSEGKKLGSSKGTASFYKPIRRAPEIADLFYKTYLKELASEILDGHAMLRDSLGQIAYTEQSDLAKAEGMPMDKKHRRWGWHIDAGHAEYKALSSDFSFLIGVALSEGQEIDENRGQFTVFPGSHVLTQQKMREVVLSGVEDVMETFKKNRPNVGEPVRALLRRGHVMIAHQRLAHAPGVNLSDVTRKNIYFRAVHDEHDALIRTHMTAPTPWTGFYGLREFLPEGATEGL